MGNKIKKSSNITVEEKLMKFYRQYRNYSGNNIAILQKFNDDFDNGKNRNVITGVFRDKDNDLISNLYSNNFNDLTLFEN